MIGTEWAPLIINSEEEFNITVALHSSGNCSNYNRTTFTGNDPFPLVGGSTNETAVYYYETPELYFPNNSGKFKNHYNRVNSLNHIKLVVY